MKMFAAVFTCLLALANALPATEVGASRQNRLISDQIVSAIENVSQNIKDAGLDPFNLERLSIQYALPVPVLFDVSAHLADVVVSGVSNIVVYNMNYALFSGRLTMDVGLPRIEATLASAGLDFTVLGKNIKASTNFKFAAVNVRIAGIIHVNVGIITGIFLRDANLEFSLGGIEFDGDVNVIGTDLSSLVRQFLTEAVPNQINAVRSEINELINLVVLEVGNGILN